MFATNLPPKSPFDPPVDPPLIRGAGDFPVSPLNKGGWGGSNVKAFINKRWMVKELKSARLLNPGWCVTALQHISAFVVNTLQAPNAPY